MGGIPCVSQLYYSAQLDSSIADDVSAAKPNGEPAEDEEEEGMFAMDEEVSGVGSLRASQTPFSPRSEPHSRKAVEATTSRPTTQTRKAIPRTPSTR